MSVHTLKTPLYFFHQLLFENYIELLCDDFVRNKQYVVYFGLSNEFNTTKTKTLENYFEFFLKQFRVKAFDKINADVKLMVESEKEQYLVSLEASVEMYCKQIKTVEKYDWLKSLLNNELKLVKDYLNVNFGLILELAEINRNTELYFDSNTTEFPFQFFDSLIYGNGYDRLRNSFYFKTVHTKDYRFLSEMNKEFTFEAWLKKDDMSEQLHFEAYIKEVLNYYANDSLKLIQDVIKNVDSKLYLKTQLDVLLAFYNKIEDFKKDEYQQLDKVLSYMALTLKAKYSYLGVNHKLFKLLLDGEESNVSSNFLPVNGLSKKFFIDLYDLTAYKLQLIDDVEVSEDMFLDVFVYENPQPESFIKFEAANAVVAYYLDKLSPFFENFTRVTIEKSSLFLNKQGKTLNQIDLNTASSRGVVKPELKIKIDTAFDGLKNKYLK